AVPAAKARISGLPWVRSAEIVRHLPNSLHITLQEYTAYALWQHDGRYTLIDRDGTAIISVANAPPEMPVLVGQDAPAHVDALFTALDEQVDIRRRVKAAVRFGGRRWDILLDAMDGGITIKLPEKNVTDALSGLAALDAKHQLLSRAVSEIDLRIEGRLVVQLKDGYAPIPQQSRYSPAEREVRTDIRVVPDKELPKGV
ncbi:MAG: FtsQ-type POTRA domain-containing protein, partial [Rhodospirillaceae bacterium]|nr:FtsQ-type POTRA domain-containing protein [Rhodospirillaceae bacterium]